MSKRQRVAQLTVRNRKPRKGEAPFSVTIEAEDVAVWLDCLARVNAALQASRDSLIELGRAGGKVRQRHSVRPTGDKRPPPPNHPPPPPPGARGRG